MGSYHTLDIPFVFYNMDTRRLDDGLRRRARYQLGHVMSAAWAAFARTGNPNHADMPNWPKFEPNDLADDGVRRHGESRERSEQGRAAGARGAAREAVVASRSTTARAARRDGSRRRRPAAVSSCRDFRRAARRACGRAGASSLRTTRRRSRVTRRRSCTAADRGRTTATRGTRTKHAEHRADRRRAIVLVLHRPAPQHEHGDVHDREHAEQQQRRGAAERAHAAPAREREREHGREQMIADPRRAARARALRRTPAESTRSLAMP